MNSLNHTTLTVSSATGKVQLFPYPVQGGVIQNTGSARAYFGNLYVSNTSYGFFLNAGERISMDTYYTNDQIYVVCDTSTTISILYTR